MRKLIFAMNATVDGYIAAPGDDLGWSGGDGPDSSPGDEFFRWWSDRVEATGLALYGRKLWEEMSSSWPTADEHCVPQESSTWSATDIWLITSR